MSSHYQRPDEKLPDDVIDRILKSRNVNQGLFNLRQLFFGKFDMLVHTSKGDHPRLRSDISRLAALPDVRSR